MRTFSAVDSEVAVVVVEGEGAAAAFFFSPCWGCFLPLAWWGAVPLLSSTTGARSGICVRSEMPPMGPPAFNFCTLT
jgi:hypothetical protein